MKFDEQHLIQMVAAVYRCAGIAHSRGQTAYAREAVQLANSYMHIVADAPSVIDAHNYWLEVNDRASYR
jgi:hypothetical protein